MADLQTYSTLDEKRQYFGNGEKKSFKIKTKDELEKWFEDVESTSKNIEISKTALIYRGMTEAKHKLYTSAQQIWIKNEMQQWAKMSFFEFVIELVKRAKKNNLIKKVFDCYKYSSDEREFPILSILQHYGAPTPLMDWTYNNNVAFYFATDNIIKKESPKNEIDDYFSIYRIDKRKHKEFQNVIDFVGDENYPGLSSFSNFGKEDNANSNSIFFISDFEKVIENFGDAPEIVTELLVKTKKPVTSIYNQNIIPQEGLFIFNPFCKKTLEEIFKVDFNKNGWNLELTPFDCFNLHKDLAEYLKRKINIKYQINKSLLFPNLFDEAIKIKEETLNGLI